MIEVLENTSTDDSAEYGVTDDTFKIYLNEYGLYTFIMQTMLIMLIILSC